MLKKTIKYEDYDGTIKTVDAYFNLTKTECVDMNLEYEAEGGLVGHLKKVIADKKDGVILQKPAVDFVKLMIERAYGVRPKDDPSMFIKEDEDGKPLFRRFKQSAAYDAYVYALLSGEESLDEFATSVLPKMTNEQKAEAEKMMKQEGLDKIVKLNPAEG